MLKRKGSIPKGFTFWCCGVAKAHYPSLQAKKWADSAQQMQSSQVSDKLGAYIYQTFVFGESSLLREKKKMEEPEL